MVDRNVVLILYRLRMKAVFRNIRQPWCQIGVIRVRKPSGAPQVYYSK